MAEESEEYTVAPDPFHSGKILRAKVLKHEVVKEDWNEYKLADGTRVKIKMEVNLISQLIDPKTGKPLRNPQSGEPVLNVNSTGRLVMSFSSEALKQYEEG
jgi:hypothetical protein